MKKIISTVLFVCIMLSFVACGPTMTPEEVLESNKQAFADFKADWNSQEVLAVNARVETDANGDRMLKTDVINNSDSAISVIVVCFAIWDTEGNFMPVQTRKHPDNTIPEFQMDLTDVTVAAGETWSDNLGVFLSEGCPEIGHVEAAIVSYNVGSTEQSVSLYETWKLTFLNQHLEDWMKESND